ncbi:hypothetical protein TNCV_4701151 [Trichonephila clavipes]|nr:hypothetical protein TNCV_4701151 [Trichonephila clavipes]
MRMIVMYHAATSRTKVQQIQSVTPHSVFARTIQHRFQQNGMSISWLTLDWKSQAFCHQESNERWVMDNEMKRHYVY